MRFDAHILQQNGLTAIIDGVPHTVCSTHQNYEKIKQALLEDNPKDFLRYKDVSSTIQRSFDKAGAVGVEVKHGQVYYNGEPVYNDISKRILEHLEHKLSFKSLTAFLANLMQNPAKSSVEQLFRFLEHKNIPITEDGCFLGYKGVTNDYRDCHTRTFDNRVGQRHEMPRNQVDDNRGIACGSGFHVGSLEYATDFGARTVIVKVNPKDAVSVPTDSSEQKLRVCAYEVVGEYTGPLVGPSYKADSVSPSDDYDYDDEEEDDYTDDSDDDCGDDCHEECDCDDEAELYAEYPYGTQYKIEAEEDVDVLDFTYCNASGIKTRRTNVEVKQIQGDRFIAMEDGQYKTFVFDRMTDIKCRV
jgi:hypothetical protein